MKCIDCKFCTPYPGDEDAEPTGSCAYYESHRPLMIPRTIRASDYFPDDLWIENCNEEFPLCYCFVEKVDEVC